jgi:hypothetical protein
MASTAWGGRMALFKAGEDVVVDALQRADDELAAGGGHLLPHFDVLEHVLYLCRAVEGQLRAALMERAYDRQRVPPAVEEVGIAERDVPRAHLRQVLDIAQDDLRLHDADAPVVHGGDRAMPAPMHTPVAGLHVPDQPLLPVPCQAGVTLESGQQLARRQLEGAALQLDD